MVMVTNYHCQNNSCTCEFCLMNAFNFCSSFSWKFGANMYTHTHAHAHTYTHAQTHTHTHTRCTHSGGTHLLSPSKPALDCLCTTRLLESCVEKFHKEGSQNLKLNNDHNTTWQDKDSYFSPGTHWCGSGPVHTNSSTHSNFWVDWSNVSKVVAWMEIKLGIFNECAASSHTYTTIHVCARSSILKPGPCYCQCK